MPMDAIHSHLLSPVQHRKLRRRNFIIRATGGKTFGRDKMLASKLELDGFKFCFHDLTHIRRRHWRKILCSIPTRRRCLCDLIIQFIVIYPTLSVANQINSL